MWKRLVMLWTVVRIDLRMLWHALRHPESPRWLKFGVAAIALYLLSPVDLIPDWVPVLGVLDDLILVPMAIRWLLAKLPPHIRAEAGRRAAAGEGPHAFGPMR